MIPVHDETSAQQKPSTRPRAAHLSTHLKLLVVLDSSDASARALRYLSDFFARRRDTRFCLAHLAPKIPARLLESGGAEEPHEEERVEAALDRAQERWLASSDQTSEDVVGWARTVLLKGGAPARAISTCQTSPLDNRTTVDKLLLAAGEQQCRTIVIGHFAHTWFQGLGEGHLAERLVREAKGLAVWVID